MPFSVVSCQFSVGSEEKKALQFHVCAAVAVERQFMECGSQAAAFEVVLPSRSNSGSQACLRQAPALHIRFYRLLRRVAPARPQNDAVRGHARKVAHQPKNVGFIGTRRAQKPARQDSFHRRGSVRKQRQVAIQAGLLEHRTPEFPFWSENGLTRAVQ